MNLFSFLKQVKYFKFNASAGKNSKTGWNGNGSGTVFTKKSDNRIFFIEDGLFKLDTASQYSKISNEYIWEQISPSKIKLSHARFGYDNAVILFDLIQVSDIAWESEKAHICVDDLYSAKLEILNNKIILNWYIYGPKKDESIKYIYSFK